MRFFLLIAFFALIAVVVAAKAGAQHGQHGGPKHGVPQGGLPPNATHLPLNSTSGGANVTIAEPSASTTEANATAASSTST